MHPNVSPADKAVYAASAALDKLLSQARAFRAGLAATTLPDAANRCLDHSDDLARILISQLCSADEIVTAELERIQEAEEVAFVRVHGVIALSEGQLVDRDFARWTNRLAANDDRASKAVL